MTAPPKLRHVAVHAHIFKNAGTSFDTVLKACFGPSLFSYDKPSTRDILSIAEVSALVAERPEMRCLVSLQVRWPLPVLESVLLHPMFFLRDPIERVQSCFHFERDVHKLYADTLTMEEYVRRKLANPRISAVIGLQTSMLCDNRLLSPERLKGDLTRDAVDSAVAALHAAPNFGLVDHFAESVQGFARRLQRHFPELAKAANHGDIHRNASKHGMTTASDKIKYVRESLTAGTYVRLLNQIAPDRALYEEAKNLFFARFASLALEPA